MKVAADEVGNTSGDGSARSMRRSPLRLEAVVESVTRSL